MMMIFSEICARVCLNEINIYKESNSFHKRVRLLDPVQNRNHVEQRWTLP